MICPLCGTQFPDGSLECPHCKVAQASIKTVDQASSSPPVQSGQPIIYQELYMPEQPTPYQGPYAPGSGMPPANAPMYRPLPSSRPRKKKTFTIVELVVAGVVVLLVIGTILLHNAFTVILNTATTITVDSSQKALNPYTKQTETLAISDPLLDNSIGDKHNYHWRDDFHDQNTNSAPTAPKGCYFEDKSYHTSTYGVNLKNPEVYCVPSGAHFSNFTYQVQMTIQLGRLGGIVFRQSPGTHFYAFAISDKGGYFVFSRSGADSNLLASGTSNYIKQLPGVSNILGVVANGDKLDLYVNQHQIASVTDSTYSTGFIGMIAMADGDDAQIAVIDYQDAKVWISSK